jgi:hypothetical protein
LFFDREINLGLCIAVNLVDFLVMMFFVTGYLMQPMFPFSPSVRM